jgi:3-oxoadipate enol-lactonase
MSYRWRRYLGLALGVLGAASVSAAPPRTSGVASVNGTRLYYEAAGAGLPVVLVSGGGTLDRRQWDDQFDVLSSRYRVIRYDIRGIGRSMRPTTEFSHHEDLRAFLEFLNIKRAVICGVSFGAAIAIDFALDNREKVIGLVLASADVSSEKHKGVEAVRALTAVAKNQGLERAIKLVTVMPSFVSPRNAPAQRRIRQIYLDNRDLFEAGFPLVTLWQPAAPPAGNRLSEIDVPALVISGSNDSPTAVAAADRIVSSLAGAQKVVIPDAGHMVNMDAPARFNRAVRSFLDSAAVTARGPK